VHNHCVALSCVKTQYIVPVKISDNNLALVTVLTRLSLKHIA
jgi:hypothetical protein